MGELKEVASEIFGLENNKIVKTIVDLTRKPGETIRAYCKEGNKNYLRPFSYMFAVIGLTILVYQFTPHTYLESDRSQREMEYKETIRGLDKTSPEYEFQHKTHTFNQQFSNFLQSQYGQYFFAALITLIHLLVFRNLNEGLKNNVFFTIFCFSHTSFMSAILSPLSFVQNSSLDLAVVGTSLAIVFLYRTWACKQFYEITWKRSILKNILLYFLLSLFLIVSIIITTLLILVSVK